MVSKVELYLQRAKNEHMAAEAMKKLSEDKREKNNFDIPEETTFYSSVISHSYFSIFFSAKALLKTEKITTDAPHVHRKTFEKFKENFVESGILDVKLLELYEKMVVRADELLQIFKEEKWKRGQFTYKTLPQANKEPADNSLQNATKFLGNIKKVIEKRNDNND